VLGYYFGAKQELIMGYAHEISIGFIGLAVVGGVVWFVTKKRW